MINGRICSKWHTDVSATNGRICSKWHTTISTINDRICSKWHTHLSATNGIICSKRHTDLSATNCRIYSKRHTNINKFSKMSISTMIVWVITRPKYILPHTHKHRWLISCFMVLWENIMIIFVSFSTK